MKALRERDIEAELVKRVKALGGEVRKVKWIGRNGAPDRLVMLPYGVDWAARGWPHRGGVVLWIELKRPGKLAAFPADAHERAQHREHERMRKMGQVVVVVDSLAGVDEVLR